MLCNTPVGKSNITAGRTSNIGVVRRDDVLCTTMIYGQISQGILRDLVGTTLFSHFDSKKLREVNQNEVLHAVLFCF